MPKQKFVAEDFAGHTCEKRGKCTFEIDVVAVDRQIYAIEVSADTPYETFQRFGRWLNEHDLGGWDILQEVIA